MAYMIATQITGGAPVFSSGAPLGKP